MKIGDVKRFYLTTAIDYANSRPHLGHSYEKVAADVVARYQRLRGREVFLQVGIDEHSVNVARKAQEQGLTPKEYCDQMAVDYGEFVRELNVDYQRLIRTSDEDHRRVVQDVVLKLGKAGYIYPAKYEGWYCPSCEAFYRERDLVNGKCPVHDFLTPQWISEYNYYFRLSAFEEPIRAHVAAHPDWVVPETRQNAILRRLEDGLEDISISREIGNWGIPVPPELIEYVQIPEDGVSRCELAERLRHHKVYIWFDALLNYITCAGYGTPEFAKIWPADVQLVGLDIPWFHAVVQSAILLALEIPLPKKIYVHGFITRDGRKISSSLGNLIFPQEIIEVLGIDPLRYYFFRRVSFGQNGDFTWPELFETYNASLANIFGNLVYRSLKMTEKYFQSVIPAPGQREVVDQALIDDRNLTIREAGKLLDSLELSQGLSRIEEFVRRSNRYIDETSPWAITDQERLQTVIAHLLDAIYHIAILLKPFIPGTADEVLARLGQPGEVAWPEETEELRIATGVPVRVGQPLFPRYEVK